MTFDETKHARDGGGQFADQPHDEAAGVSLATLPPPIPAWGGDLDALVDEKINGLVFEFNGDTERDSVINLIDVGDEDELVAAYGQARADWLIGLEVEVTGEVYETSRASWTGPAESATNGWVTITDAAGNEVATGAFDHDDGADDLPYLIRLCPVNEDGTERIDLDDPAWGQLTPNSNGKRTWSAAGFHDPAEAVAWQAFSTQPKLAQKWAQAGFTPDEAAVHRGAGIQPGTAVYQRRLAAEAAEKAAAAAAADEATPASDLRGAA